MKSETTNDLKYKARVYIDRAVLPKIEEDLKVIVYSLIGNKKLEIRHEPEGFDPYPFCKDSSKEWCPYKRKKYEARLPERALCWYGDSYIEIYCEIIASIAGRKVYMPFSSIPWSALEDEQRVEAKGARMDGGEENE